MSSSSNQDLDDSIQHGEQQQRFANVTVKRENVDLDYDYEESNDKDQNNDNQNNEECIDEELANNEVNVQETNQRQHEFRELVDDMILTVSTNDNNESSNQFELTSQQIDETTTITLTTCEAPIIASSLDDDEEEHRVVELSTLTSCSQDSNFIQLSSMSLNDPQPSTSSQANETEFCELSRMELDEEQPHFTQLTSVTSTQYYEMSNVETGEQEFCIIESMETTEEDETYVELSNASSTGNDADESSNMTLIGEHELLNNDTTSYDGTINETSNDGESSSGVPALVGVTVKKERDLLSDEQEQQPSNGQDKAARQRMRRANITDRQKYLIEFLHTENGLSAEEIRQHKSLIRADGTKILLKTVKYWLDRLKKTGEMKTLHRSGRPRFLDEEKERELINYIDNNSKKNYHVIKRNIHLTCTRRTVNNYALRNGIKAFRALKKPKLTDPQKAARLRFCEEWLLRPEDARKIIFTDEKLFAGQPTNNHQLVRRRKGERYEEKNINHTNRPNLSTSTNVWCYIGPFGKGEIFLAENDEYFDEDGNRIKRDPDPSKVAFFNNTSYKNMLEKRAIPAMRRQIDDFIFMQDNASIHSAMNKDKTDTVIGELLKKEKVPTMYWPPLSPDLNPIENIHHLLQNEMNDELTLLEKKPKNKKEVFSILKQCWTRVDNEVVKKIYFSFYGRLSKVIERQGSNNYD